MSKLTGWINPTDSLDIQGIVDKYESNIMSNNINKETSILEGDEVWSGSIEGSIFTTNMEDIDGETKIESQIINQPKSVEDIKTSESSIQSNPKNRTILFDNDKFSAIQNNIQEQKIESKTTLNKFNNTNNERPSFGMPPPPPPVTSFKRNANVEPVKPRPFVPKFEVPHVTPNFNNDNNNTNNNAIPNITNEPLSETNNEPIKMIDTKDLINFNVKNTKLFDIKRETKKFNTIKFKNTNELQEQQPEPKIRTNDFNLNTNSQEKYNFINKDSFQKQVEASDEKTIKFQSMNMKPEDTFAKTTNLFTAKLTNIFFKETAKAEDLDLTKEINDADAITINASTESKPKRRFSFFKRRK